MEPFVGSAVVFMNTEFKEYVLGDANRDLIELYKYAMVTPEALISEMKPAFAEGFSKERYLELRDALTNETTTFLALLCLSTLIALVLMGCVAIIRKGFSMFLSAITQSRPLAPVCLRTPSSTSQRKPVSRQYD